MSLHKTPQNKRNAIRYQFYDGEGRKEPLITIVPGKDDVTEIDISHFYSAEDSEVYHNIRALNPNAWLTEADRKALREQKDEWARQYVCKQCLFDQKGSKQKRFRPEAELSVLAC